MKSLDDVEVGLDSNCLDKGKNDLGDFFQIRYKWRGLPLAL